MLRRIVLLSILTALSGAAPALGATLHDEGVNGDLSNDRLNPTAHVLSPGSNVLFATMGPSDLDYLTLSLPQGLTLDQIMLVSHSGDSFVSFIAVQSGATFTVPPTTATASGLLGWAHFGGFSTDLLASMSTGAGAIGFTPPLRAGTYTFWLQEVDAPVQYALDFKVSAVP